MFSEETATRGKEGAGLDKIHSEAEIPEEWKQFFNKDHTELDRLMGLFAVEHKRLINLVMDHETVYFERLSRIKEQMGKEVEKIKTLE